MSNAYADGEAAVPAPAGTSPQKSTVSPGRAVLAGALGNLIEYYDFALYGVLALTMAPLFFPSDQPGSSILSTLAVFAVAFLMRPIGGWYFGRLGDRKGRRRALVATVITMGISSSAVGVLPTHASAGYVAPILLVLARLAQGFSAGGELSGSATYISESAPPGRRGLFISVAAITTTAGFSVAAAVVGVTATAMSSEQMSAWGWRIPFLISLPLALFCMWARLRLGETGEFEAMVDNNEVEKSPLRKVFKDHRGSVIRLFGLTVGNTGIGYLGVTYLSVYLIGTQGFDAQSVYWVSAVAIALACCAYPVVGVLVDRFGRKRMLILGYSAFIVVAWPTFVALDATSSVLIAGLIFVAYQALTFLYNVPNLVVAAELFPRRVRYTGTAISINLATIVAGGTSPYVAQWLVQTTGDARSPAWWIMAIAAIALVAALTLRETSHDKLPA